MSGPKAAGTRDDGTPTCAGQPSGEAFTSVTAILSGTEGKPPPGALVGADPCTFQRADNWRSARSG